jgi:alpha-1,2-mannosyltransferase
VGEQENPVPLLSSRAALSTMIVVNVIAVSVAVYLLAGREFDLEVYRVGARTWFDGGDLYSPMLVDFVGASFPFTYPPISAPLLLPLALLPRALSGTLMIVGSAVLMVAVAYRVLLSLNWFRGDRIRMLLVSSAVSTAMLEFEPFRATLMAGQINVALMALVVFDCLVPSPKWPRGLLIGIAAAVKLTPAVFVLYFLIRRDWRAAITSGLAFLGTTVLGVLLAPSESARYWLHLIFDTDRPGSPVYAGNQSLRGLLSRLGLTGAPQTIVWALASLAVLALAVLAMRKLDPPAALVVNAVAGLLVSPISWTHHWVWVLPALLVLAADGRRVVATLVAVAFVVGPLLPVPNTGLQELDWTCWQRLLGNSYVEISVLALVLIATRRTSLPAPQAQPPQRQPLPSGG